MSPEDTGTSIPAETVGDAVSSDGPSASTAQSSGTANDAIASSDPTGDSAQSVEAQSVEAQSVFEGGGFTVTITGSGADAAYRGCSNQQGSSQQDCLDIPQAANFTRGTYTWENGGYTYVMAPATSETDAGAYQLRVYDPARSTIVDALMTPVADGNRSGAGGSEDVSSGDISSGDVVLEPNILDAFYTQVETLGACADYLDLEASKNSSVTYPVNGDDAIVEVLCFFAAYQGAYEYWFYQATPSGGAFTPLSFDIYQETESGETSRTSVRELGGLPTYDPAQETLTLFTKYRGLGDCGAYSEYKWQGSEFELVTYRSKDDCDGNALDPADYPQIYP